MCVYSTRALRVGVYRCPPGDALWHETNDNIGERPHVVFPSTAVGLVREGLRLVVTPNDVVFYRPFETYARSLRDARGDVSLIIAPRELDMPDAPLGQADARSLLLARRLASRLHERGCALRRRDGGRADRAGNRRASVHPPATARRRAAAEWSWSRRLRTSGSHASASRSR